MLSTTSPRTPRLGPCCLSAGPAGLVGRFSHCGGSAARLLSSWHCDARVGSHTAGLATARSAWRPAPPALQSVGQNAADCGASPAHPDEASQESVTLSPPRTAGPPPTALVPAAGGPPAEVRRKGGLPHPRRRSILEGQTRPAASAAADLPKPAGRPASPTQRVSKPPRLAATSGAAPKALDFWAGQATTSRLEDLGDRTPASSLALTRHSHRLLVSYDGSAYWGWQLQPGQITVQGVFEAVLCEVLGLTREQLGVQSAGRTDAGVHADGQVVQFFTPEPLDKTLTSLGALCLRLNALLPIDIRVHGLWRTAPDFNVTSSALGKVYHYTIQNSLAYHPLLYRGRLHVWRPLDLTTMRDAAALMVGRHDFTHFSNNAAEGRDHRNPVRTLQRVDLTEQGGGVLRIEIEGGGFLYKMVRHLVGCLIGVGHGTVSLDLVRTRLTASNPTLSSGKSLRADWKVAPAHGLCLVQVCYPPQVDDYTAFLHKPGNRGAEDHAKELDEDE